MPTPTAQETFVSNMSALATAIKDKTGASLPLSIVGMTEAINTLAFEPAKIVALDFSGGITAQTVTPDAGYTHLQSVYIQKPADFESYIRHGSIVAGVTGNYTYVSQNAAAPAQILSGYKAFVNGGGVMTGTYSVGTYEVASTATIFSSASTSSYVMSKTIWSTNAASKVTIWRPADLVASKIAPGATIFGVAGTYETATIPLAITLNFSDGTDVTYNPPSGQHYSQVTVAIPMAKASIASIIAQGKSLMGINGNYTNDATATAATILYNNTAYVKGSKISGTYKISTVSVAAGTLNFSASTTYNVAIPSGYNAVSAITVSQPTNLTAGNIKAGVTIAGILGTFTNPGNLSAVSGDTHGGTEATGDEIITKDLIKNKIAYSKGKKYKGSYSVTDSATLAAANLSFATDDVYTYTVSGYDAASIVYIQQPPNLLPGNIKKNVTIAGITGTYDNYPETEAPTVDLAMSDGNQVILATSGKLMTSVTVTKPADLTAENIKTGATIGGISGNFTADGTLTGTGTGTTKSSTQLRSGIIAYSQGVRYQGSMAEKAAATYNTSTSNQSIAANQYLTGAQTILAVQTSNIVEANIVYGVNVKVGDSNNTGRIKNITGTFSTSDSTSVAVTSSSGTVWESNEMAENKTAFLMGHKIKGTAPAISETTIITSSDTRTLAAGSFLAGKQTILGVTTSGISAANIKYNAVVKVGDSQSAGRIKEVTGTFTSDGTLTGTGTGTTISSAQMLSGVIAYSKGQRYSGSISSKAAAAYEVASSDRTITSGQYLSGAQTILGVKYSSSTLIPANILNGVVITIGDSADEDRLVKVTGNYKTSTYTVPANTITLSNGGTIDISSSSLNAMTKVTINTNSIVGLSADKIRYNQSIAGISGLYTSDGTATAASIVDGYIAYSKGTRYVGTAPSEEQIYAAINAQTFGS